MADWLRNISWASILIGVTIGIWLGAHTGAGQILDQAIDKSSSFISSLIGQGGGGRSGRGGGYEDFGPGRNTRY